MALSLLSLTHGFAAPPTPASPGERAAWLLGNMTLEQKIVLFHGPTDQSCHKSWCKYVGNVEGQTITTVDLNNKTEKVVIPPLTMNDGPQGLYAAAILLRNFCCAILRPPVSLHHLSAAATTRRRARRRRGRRA